MLIMDKTIDNSDFIKAVSNLKFRGVIKRNKDISDIMQCSESIVSDYVNNKKKIGELFWIKFTKKFDLVNFEKGSFVNEPDDKYGKFTDFRADYVIIAVLEKQLREQEEQTKLLRIIADDCKKAKAYEKTH